MKWQPIETAPKDGRPVLLRGGKTDEDDYRSELMGLVRRPVVGIWIDDHLETGWAVAYWDGAWRTFYDDPKQWAPIAIPASRVK